VSYDDTNNRQLEFLYLSQVYSSMAKPQIIRTRDRSLVWPRMPGAADASILVLDNQLTQSQQLDANRIEALQLHQLKSLINHAFATVPYYKKRLENVCARGENEALNLEMWQRIPVLTRQQVLDAGSELHSTTTSPAFEPTSEATTSGTTGTPVTVKRSGVDQLFFLANNLRSHRWAGLDFSKSMASIAPLTARTKDLAARNQAVPWAEGHVSGPLYHFDSARPIGEKIDWLLKTKPAYLTTTPSCLVDLINQCKAQSTPLPGLERVVTTGETLNHDVRALCDKEWGISVSDLYKAQEVGIITAQCPDTPHCHTMAETIMVEVLREDGTPCRAGEVGRLVVTPLHNFVMPLIKYDLGDYGELDDTPCTCGRGLPVIRNVHKA
jgi:phenylacetate-CoA ligase